MRSLAAAGECDSNGRSVDVAGTVRDLATLFIAMLYFFTFRPAYSSMLLSGTTLCVYLNTVVLFTTRGVSKMSLCPSLISG